MRNVLGLKVRSELLSHPLIEVGVVRGRGCWGILRFRRFPNYDLISVQSGLLLGEEIGILGLHLDDTGGARARSGTRR